MTLLATEIFLDVWYRNCSKMYLSPGIEAAVFHNKDTNPENYTFDSVTIYQGREQPLVSITLPVSILVRDGVILKRTDNFILIRQ